jgi:hypothetical protein
MGIIVFCLVAAASGWARQRLCVSRGAAVLGATVTSVAGFQLLVFAQLGHLDPFAPIAAAITSVPAALIALAIDVALRKPPHGCPPRKKPTQRSRCYGTLTTTGHTLMPKPNYQFEKRQREQQKSQKKAEKAQRKSMGVPAAPEPVTPPPQGEPSPD